MPRWIPLFAALTVWGCQTPSLSVWTPQLSAPRITRVNLRPDGIYIRSSSVLSRPMTLPAGSPAEILRFSDREVDVRIREVVYTFVPASGRFDTSEEGVARFIDKYFTTPDKKEDLEALEPRELLPQVKVGDVMRGMTKEQVYVALGPPYAIEGDRDTTNLSREEILKSDRWTYIQEELAGVIPRRVVYVFAGGKLQETVP